ncbi:MAG: ABC transporter permease [Anaerolineae bacterium]
MSIVWRKAWRDLAHNKLRTILAVLSTAVGVFAMGMVFGMSGLMHTWMTEDHRATNPAHITFWGGPFDQTAIEAVLGEPAVADVEGEIQAGIRWKLAGEPDWRDGDLVSRADYDAQRMHLVDLVDGHWPRGRALAVERQSLRHFGVPLDSTILVEFGRHERRLPIEGVIRSPDVFPPQMGGNAAFFATGETVAWLTGQEDFNQLDIRLESFSQEGAEKAAERIEDRLEHMGLAVYGPWIVDPESHWAEEQMAAVFPVLAVLGGLSLGLSVFLIVNTMNAIVTRQVWQIGVMKVVGATRGRVVRVYLTTALVYGVLALFLAVPLGAVGAHLLAGVLLALLNIRASAFQIVPNAVAIQIAVGLAVPLLAALVPVIGGARISPHACISSYGLGGGFGRGWLDRLIGRVRRLPRPMALSLRNTFRRKARVALTLITLTLAGVTFIMVMSVSASFSNTIEVLLSDFGFDVLVVFDRTHRAARLVEATESVPGVTCVEVWEVQGASLMLDDGEELQGQLWGVPGNSEMFNPRIISGRALLPEDDHALLLNSKIAADEGIGVGDEVTLTIAGEEVTWTVVGLVVNINNDQRDNFVPYDTLAQETGNVNRGDFVMVMSEEHDFETHERLIRDLRATYTARRLKAVYFRSAGEVRKEGRAQFDILVYLMLTMAILAALVGSIGLMGTTSINVAERGREIGVMRAIGATSPVIAGIFVGEGMLLGALSWLLAVPFGYPGALAFSNLVGNKLLNLPFDFRYSMGGVMLWLAIVLVLSALASLWPALRATKVSVHEALAYE